MLSKGNMCKNLVKTRLSYANLMELMMMIDATQFLTHVFDKFSEKKNQK